MRLDIQTDLSRLRANLDKRQMLVVRAIAQGLNEGGDKTRTQVQKVLKDSTSLVNLRSVTNRIRTTRAFIRPDGAGMQYQIIVQGRPTTHANEFRTKVTRGLGGGVSILMWNVWHKFKRSFQGTGQIFGALKMRMIGPRLPLRSFHGPNLAQEAAKDLTVAVFTFAAAAEVPAMIEKRLGRIQ